MNLLLLLVIAGLISSPAQSLSDKGTVTGNVYTNKTLGLTWEFPANWQVQNNPASAPANTQILLEVLPNGTQSGESIAMIAIDPSYFNENSPPTFNETWVALPRRNSVPDVSSLTVGNGLLVHRYDFKSAQEPTRYLTFLSGPRKNYGIDFITIANSTINLEEMIHALVEMKIRPDWPANSAPIAGHLESQDKTQPETVRVSDKVANSFRLKNPVAPVYPIQARAGGVQGVVKLLGHIGTDGKIKDLYLLSGPPLLCNPAIAAVSQWKYQPYLLQGKPVEVETIINIIFKLGG